MKELEEMKARAMQDSFSDGLSRLIQAVEVMDRALENADTALADSALADPYKAGALHDLHSARNKVKEILKGDV